MSISSLTQSPKLALPVHYDGSNGGNYRTSLIQYLNDYRDLLWAERNDPANASDPLMSSIIRETSTVDALCTSLISIFDYALLGQHAKAYALLDNTLIRLQGHINKLTTPYQVSPKLDSAYRVRDFGFDKVTRGGIFHISEKDRHLTSAQRYSHPGIPCLYLGGSAFISCLECKIDFSNQDPHISRFKVSGPLKLLNFAYTPWFWSNIGPLMPGNQKYQNIIISYFILLPLMASCTIHNNSVVKMHFREDHVMPRLVFEWIIENGSIDGIRYLSTRIPSQIHNMNENPSLLCNYAFPAMNFEHRGYSSKLISHFEFTDPVPWSKISQVTPASQVAPNNLPHRTNFVVDSTGKPIPWHTDASYHVSINLANQNSLRKGL